MSNACPHCPCPAGCLARPVFCEWAAEQPPDPVKLAHIRARSAGPPVRRPAGPPAYPSLAQQVVNLAGAVGRVVAAAAQGQPITVAPVVYYERLEICRGCEFNGEAPFGVRCTKCGCGGAKLQLATERCPLDPPKWDRVTSPPAEAPGTAC